MTTIYVCYSEYTLINCINHRASADMGNEPAVLLLFNRNDVFTKNITNFQKLNIFDDIFVFPFINNLSFFQRLLIFIIPKFLLGVLRPDFRNFLSSKSNKVTKIICQSLYLSLIMARVFHLSKFYLIEDGLSSYTGRASRMNVSSLSFKIIDRLFYRGGLVNAVEGIYLNKPELSFDENTFKIKIQPNHDFRYVDNAFSVTKTDIYLNKKFIYLSSPTFGIMDLLGIENLRYEDFRVRFTAVMTSMFYTLDAEQLVIRKSPIEKIIDYKLPEGATMDGGLNNWESQLRLSVTENTFLISFFSTASITPYLLGHTKPKVIFLYRLLGYEAPRLDQVVSKLITLQDYEQKFFVPKTFDEFKAIIE